MRRQLTLVESDCTMDEKEEAIRKVAVAFGCTCDAIRRGVDYIFDKTAQQQMFDTAKRQIRLLSKGKSKSYLSQYAKFDKLKKKRK